MGRSVELDETALSFSSPLPLPPRSWVATGVFGQLQTAVAVGLGSAEVKVLELKVTH